MEVDFPVAHRMIDSECPLVSVLVPAYNHERYIIECLNSVLIDDYPRKELLLIDDGSVDGTYRLAAEWATCHGGRFERCVFSRQANAGITSTLNRLVSLAEGEYLVPLASDDYLISGGITPRIQALVRRPEWLAVFADCKVVNEFGDTIHHSGLVDLFKADKKALRFDEERALELILRWSAPGPVILIRRAAFHSPAGVGLYDETQFSEDRDFYLRLLSRRALGFLDQYVAVYRWRERSAKNLAMCDGSRSGILAAEKKNLQLFSGCEHVALNIVIQLNEARLPKASGGVFPSYQIRRMQWCMLRLMLKARTALRSLTYWGKLGDG